MRPSDRGPTSFSAPRAAQRPIGIFDSGVGGLTVLRALRRALPQESTVYLGDTARLPYGTKSGEVVTRYTLKNAEFLLGHDIKMLVVACNTASAVALPALEKALTIPVLGVILPGAQVAAAQTRTGKVGVIGTPGTVASGAYQRALAAARPDVHVTARACPLFVPLAEEGWVEGEVPRLVARDYLRELKDAGVDTVVLGCTHYPLLRQTIAEELGPEVQLVDSGEAAAAAATRVLASHGLLAQTPAPPAHRAYVTDTPASFLKVAARFLGEPLATAEQVDLSY